MFRVATQKPRVSKETGQIYGSLLDMTEKAASRWRLLTHKVRDIKRSEIT